MFYRLRPYLSLLLVAVFMFPGLILSLHGRKHDGDPHCKREVTQHFHSGIHTCYLCDFVQPSYELPAECPELIAHRTVVATQTAPLPPALLTQARISGIWLRGPPCLSYLLCL